MIELIEVTEFIFPPEIIMSNYNNYNYGKLWICDNTVMPNIQSVFQQQYYHINIH